MTVCADPGSFRDATNRVFSTGGRILRTLDATAAAEIDALQSTAFAGRLVEAGHLIAWDSPGDELARGLLGDGWAKVVEHPRVPFVSYPYEWSFSMLKDAAWVHLRVLEEALENGWTLKDGTAYNVQWFGARPVFIDLGSFERWTEGEPWVGYRQFCSHFLIPLMLKAHLGIDPSPLLRSELEGISPSDAARYFRGLNRMRAGVLSHVILPAAVEASVLKRERDDAPVERGTTSRHSKAMVVGLVQGLQRLVKRLRSPIRHTDWSHYAGRNTYNAAEHERKVDFVRRAVGRQHRAMVWDLGCNTGTFSKVAAELSDYVVSVDGDADSIEQLYLKEHAEGGGKILPLVMNLANLSPGQGWMGKERAAFDQRAKPDLVMCLALIHHIRVSANIPLDLFLDWLRSLGAEIVIEFVDRHDEMFVKLLARKTVTYPDYSLEAFERLVAERFRVVSREPLKDDRRQIYHLAPT